MKKLISMLLAMLMLASLLAACGGQDNTTTPETTTTPVTTAPAATVPVVEAPASALEVLENVWGKYAEEEKFSVIGGNMEANIMGAPGSYDMTYAENLTYNLLIPADQTANVTEVASMIHMMNANSFTCGAFKLAEGVTAADFGATMQSAILGNMWMCGFPDELLIVNVADTYVIAAFGVADLMAPFATHLAEAYPEAVTLYSEPVV